MSDNPSTEIPAGFRPVYEAVLGVERAVGVPPGFLITLAAERDDWAFALKVHAVIEAAVAHILGEHFKRKDPRMLPFFERLHYRRNGGKLALCAELDLLPPPSIRYAEALSGLRNHLAHDIATLSGFSFRAFVEGSPKFDKDVRPLWIFPTPTSSVRIGEKDLPVKQALAEALRTLLHVSAIVFVVQVSDATRALQLEKQAPGLLAAALMAKLDEKA